MLTPTPARLCRKLAAWKVRVRDRLRGETGATFFDVQNPADLADLLRRVGAELPPGPNRPDTDAGFARAALAYQARPDMRAALPLGLTPRDRGLFLAWMIAHGTRELGFTVADAVAAVVARDADPARGLADTYRLQPAWQAAVPDGLTPAGWAKLKAWAAAEYGLGSRWFRRATLPRRRRQPPADVTVLGLFRYTSGLQQAAAGMVAALDAAGVRVGLRDVPGPAVREFPAGRPLDALDAAPVAVVNVGLDTSVPDAYARAGLFPRPGVYRVANWWWELEEIPAEWRDRGTGVDEIWAPTRFVAAALASLGKPVFPMLPGLELPAVRPRPKSAFGMDPAKFTFVGLFDANSRLGRKNPFAVVEAFRTAFRPGESVGDRNVELVLKMTPPGAAPGADILRLREACGAAGVKLVEAVFSRDETLGFLAAADAVVSLHRSEGFGLPLAEAMLLGKPVVATGYSGNLDFMTPATSFLVEYSRVPIAADDPPYRRGFVWAEPSVGHAAAQMRRVFDHPEHARAVGGRAKAELAATLSVAAAGRRMRDRLDAIRAMKGGRR